MKAGMLSPFSFYMPTGLYFGPGTLNVLADPQVDFPGRKALIVTGGSSVKKYGYLERVRELLRARGVVCAVFDKVRPNPVVEHVMEAAQMARDEQCDVVVGLGGGSSMDSAKSIALMAANPGHYWDYVSGGSGKALPVPNPALPIVCITTTAGTGTEADPWTVITKSDTHEKIGFGCKETFPAMSIVDPELMTTIPPHLTAYQGFDALFHSVEGYVATCATPVSDLFALKAIELIARYLPSAVKDGSDLEARNAVAMASTFSGIVETASCCTSEHSIEHALSAYNPELPHGAGLIAVSLAYHRAYAPSCPDRYATMATLFGEEASVEGFLKGLEKLQEACGVSSIKLSDYGVRPDMIPEYAANARATMGNLFALDRATLDQQAVEEILRQSCR